MLPLSREPRGQPHPVADRDDVEEERRGRPRPNARPESGGLFSHLSRAQGAYYVLTGILALTNTGSSKESSDARSDIWSFKVTGALVSVIGVALLRSSATPTPSSEMLILGAGSAAAMGAIESRYVAGRRASAFRGLDAIAQFAFVALWVTIARSASRRSGDEWRANRVVSAV